MREIFPDGISAVLLDFDGPVCGVFSGYPAHLVADELRGDLLRLGIVATDDICASSDPLAILRWAGDEHPEVIEDIDSILTAAERRAVRSAQPTPGAHRVIVSAQRIGRPVAIVSNNSAAAIADYLSEHDISEQVAVVAARPFGQPWFMKPNPALVVQAIEHLGASPERCLFVGDAITDIQAGRAAGVRVVGYVKTSQQGAALASAGPDRLINSMSELADALDTCV